MGLPEQLNAQEIMVNGKSNHLFLAGRAQAPKCGANEVVSLGDWANSLTILYLILLVCKIGIIIVPTT